MVILYILADLYNQYEKFVLSDSFCQFLSQQKGASADGSHYATINPQLLHKIFRKKAPSFLQILMKNTMFVRTTA